jgi:hypothetical protein
VAAAGETVRPADAAEAARIAQVIRSAFGQYRGVLEPPSGALALDAAAVRDLMKLGGILVCESHGHIVACVFHRTHRLGYRQVGLDSHAGSTVPTFAWLEKPVG